MKKETAKKLRAQLIFLAALLAVWQTLYMLEVFPKILFPSIGDIIGEFIDGFREDNLAEYTLYSVSLLIRGLFWGVLLAFVFSALSMVSKTFHSIYNMLVSVFDLIPGVAILPLAILWCGIGENTIILVVVHGVIWPMSRSMLDGFKGVPKLYIEAGKNYGLKGLSLVRGIYLPASFSAFLSGMRVGWARAWRGLIAIEMIFGTTGSGAGIGWYIFMKRTNANIAGVFAALIVIILIGVFVEYVIFRSIEKMTVRKWGLTS